MTEALIESLNKRLKQEILTNLSNFAGISGNPKIPSLTQANLKSVVVSVPKNKEFGDLTTNAAMVLSPVFSLQPLKVAEALIEFIIKKWPEADAVKAVPPGFINFFISRKHLINRLYAIAAERGKYGLNNSGKGAKVQIEFVSANPTGDLHIGHGRWAALGDSLANIYAANGYEVWREYYINDYGTQIKVFARCLSSLYAKAFNIGQPYPEEGYPEELIRMVSDKIIEIYKDRFLIKKTGVREKESMEIYSPRIDETGLQNAGVSIMLERISATLSSMYVRFDEWFSESSLHNGNNLKKTLKILKEKNLTYEKEGALWFKASDFGDEKDRVMIRSGGEPTYFASDVMYLLNKISRRFEKIIYILGADHHGYVKRLQAIARSAGLESGQVKVIIGQLVRLIKKGQVVRMSKRRGKVYSLDDLIKEVGSDAIRYFFSANSFDTPMDFDIGLARQKSNKNPVYYVQYAHARIANVIGKVAELYLNKKLKYDGSSINFGCFDSYASASGTNGDGYFRMEDLNFEKLEKIEENFIKSNDFKNVEIKNNDEAGLARHLILFPDVLMDACSNDAPYMINQYIYKLASQFHYFYRHNRIMDQEKINAARFKLVFLVRIVLSSAMKLLKISAPVKM